MDTASNVIIMNNKVIAVAAVVIIVIVAIAAGISLSDDDSTGEITVTDCNGDEVTLEGTCDRVVVFSKYIAEAMIVMGVEDKAVGVSNTIYTDTNYSQYYSNVANVGDAQTSATLILTLDADLIICYSSDYCIELVNTGVPILQIGASKIDEVNHDIEALGIVLGAEDKAAELLDWFNGYYDQIVNANPDDTSFIIESSSTSRLTLCGETSTPGVLLEAIGVNNLVSGYYVYPEASAVIEMNPDVIIVATYNSYWNDEKIASYFETIKSRAGWDNITAIQNGDVYMASNDIIGGIRGVIGAMFILSFADDSFSDVDVSAMVDEYNAIRGTNFNNQMVYQI